jgi:hypothetical protein
MIRLPVSCRWQDKPLPDCLRQLCLTSIRIESLVALDMKGQGKGFVMPPQWGQP